MALKDYVTGTTNRILLGSAEGVGLIATIVAVISLYSPAYQVRDSGGLVKWAVNFRGDSTQSGAIASKTLMAANCDIKGTSTGMLVCGTDATGAGGGSAWSNTGSLQTYFDPRYVNTSGDTMTGKLLINLTTGTDALEVVQTASASKLHANTLLTVSGSVVVEDNITVDGLMSFVGYSASPQLTAADTTSGLHFDGPGIVSIHNGGTQTMLLSSTNRVGIGINSPETKLEVEGTVSGTVLYGLHSIRSSGSLTWEGAGSGASLYIGDDFDGAGLSDCDADNQTIAWDSTSKRFSCGDDDDTNTTYIAGQGLTLNGTSFSLTPSHSGTTIWATTALRSSGALTWEGAGSGATLYLGGQFEGVGLTDCDLATQTIAWDATTKRFSCGTDSDTTYTAGQGLTLTSTAFRLTAAHSGSVITATTTLASSGTLVVEGAMSGASLFVGTSLRGSGLTDCDTAGTSKLLWDTTTGRFSCGTDTDTNTTYTARQGLTLAGTSFSLTPSHSGTTIWATTTLRSSGGLVVEGTSSGSTAYFGSMFIAKPSAKARLDVAGTVSGALITQHGAGNNFFAGNVGIGKTPTTKLEVVGTISGALLTQNGAGNNYFLGNVGIGKTSPVAKLEVVGTVSGSIIRGTTLSGNVIRGENFSRRQLSMEIFSTGSTITTGSGKAFMTVPWSMSGYLLSRAWVSVGTGGYTNSTSVQVRNAEKGFRKLFSTPLTVDDRRYGSGQVVINASNRDVGAFDRLFFDIPSVATTAPKSPLVILLDFYKP